MNRGRLFGFLLLTLAVVGLVLTGCSDESTSPDSGDLLVDTPNIDDPLGGYTDRNEEPAFGEADLASSVAAEVAYEDPMAEDPEIKRMQAAHPDSINIYVATILWGMLDDDPSISVSPNEGVDVPVTDWTGRVEVNHGAILLRSVVAFEQGDHILPRHNHKRLGWVSHTTVSFDGVRIVVLQPKGGDQGERIDSLKVTAGDHQWTFLVDDLAELEYMETVDELGNKFSLRSHKTELTTNMHGFLGGAWVAPEEPEGRGTFRGRWVTRNGSVTGFLRGHFGTNSEGKKVFYGKYIDRQGNFRGILRGEWDEVGIDMSMGESPIERHHGWFRGEWVDSSGRMLGRLRGHWHSYPGEDRGFFEGGWSGFGP